MKSCESTSYCLSYCETYCSIDITLLTGRLCREQFVSTTIFNTANVNFGERQHTLNLQVRAIYVRPRDTSYGITVARGECIYMYTIKKLGSFPGIKVRRVNLFMIHLTLPRTLFFFARESRI